MASEPVLKLALLGELNALVTTDAGERRLARGKPVALLAFLSLAPGRRASRERLATLLWSDGSSEAARQNLRQTLWYVKRRLGDVLVADDDSVALRASASSDVDRFVGLADSDRFVEALDAYGGEFIPEFAAPGAAGFEEWADLERRRLRATLVACVDSAARALLATGHAADAAKLARRGRVEAPSDQSAARLLLECLVAARDLLGAAAMVAELEGAEAADDVDLEPATKALLRAAKRLRDNPDAEIDAGADAPRTLIPDLVARETEFRALVDALEGARRGRGRVILVSGAAGLGKTRLLDDFAARVASTRGRLVHVRAHPGNRSINGSLAASIAERLAALPGAAAISPGSASVLVSLSPLLNSTFRSAEPDRATGDDALRRRASALGELLQTLAESNPIALLVDDAHWADEESTRILCALRARVEGEKVLMVVATRVVDDLRTAMGGVEEIALAPLDVAGVAEFVGRLAALPTEPWSRGFVPRLHEVSHGIPLLLIETLQGLVERGALLRRDGSWYAASAESLTAAMPRESALRERLESLARAERTALLRLATLGRPATRAQLVGSSSDVDWETALGALEHRGFIAVTTLGVSAWHDEVARGVLDVTTPEERFDAHRWATELLLAHAESLRELGLAAFHADRAADDALLSRTWSRALAFARARGDGRAPARLAEEVLSGVRSERRVHELVHRLSPWQRLSRAGQRVAAVGAIALVGAGVIRGIDASTPRDEITLVLMHSTEGAKEPYALRFDPHGPWRAGAPLVAEVARDDMVHRLEAHAMFSATPLPDGSGWIGNVMRADSMTNELAFIDVDGRFAYVAPAAGDDHGHSLAPDGSRLAYASRRFDRVEHQSELVVWDRATETLTRLTHSANDESVPFWSPDGTRIAFRRFYQVERRFPSLCVIDVDGAHERCVTVSDSGDFANLGWRDEGTVLVQHTRNGLVESVDVSDWHRTTHGIAPGALLAIGESGFLLCRCASPAAGLRTASLSHVNAPVSLRPVLADGQELALDGGFLQLRRRGHAQRHLTRLVLRDDSLALDAGANTLAIVHGFDREGMAMQPRALRYHTTDSSIATVDPDGTVRGLNAGETWLHVRAGGWRADSSRLVVRMARVREVLREDWSRGIGAAWKEFGDPFPLIIRTGGRAALRTNGDGVFQSGVYVAEALDGHRGVGVEIRARLPVAKYKLQNLSLTIQADSPDFASWDHRTGYGGIGAQPSCSTAFPSSEGGGGVQQFELHSPDGGMRETARTPADFYGDAWHVIRLQLMPDGRCELSIDSLPPMVSTRPSATVPRVRVVLTGSTVGAELLVGDVLVWEGVRRAGRPVVPPRP